MPEKKPTKWQTAALIVGQAAHAGNITRLELLRLRELLQKWLITVQEAAEDVPNGAGTWSPALDICENNTEISITIELAGVRAEDIDIALEDKTLKISGEKRGEKTVGEISYLCSERDYGRFKRTITLRCDVLPEAVSARFADGILHITLTKTAPRQRFKIKVTQ